MDKIWIHEQEKKMLDQFNKDLKKLIDDEWEKVFLDRPKEIEKINNEKCNIKKSI